MAEGLPDLSENAPFELVSVPPKLLAQAAFDGFALDAGLHGQTVIRLATRSHVVEYVECSARTNLGIAIAGNKTVIVGRRDYRVAWWAGMLTGMILVLAMLGAVLTGWLVYRGSNWCWLSLALSVVGVCGVWRQILRNPGAILKRPRWDWCVSDLGVWTRIIDSVYEATVLGTDSAEGIELVDTAVGLRGEGFAARDNDGQEWV